MLLLPFACVRITFSKTELIFEREREKKTGQLFPHLAFYKKCVCVCECLHTMCTRVYRLNIVKALQHKYYRRYVSLPSTATSDDDDDGNAGRKFQPIFFAIIFRWTCRGLMVRGLICRFTISNPLYHGIHTPMPMILLAIILIRCASCVRACVCALGRSLYWYRLRSDIIEILFGISI